MNNRFVRATGLTLAVMFIVTSSAQADNYETTYSNLQGPFTITYTNVGDPTGTPVTDMSGYTAPFTVTDVTPGPGYNASFAAFCIDLYHSVTDGQITSNSPGFVNVAGAVGAASAGGVGIANGATATPFGNFSSYADLGSKLNYLGGVFQALQGTYGSDGYVMGAVQLAVWTLLDKNFTATGEATGMYNDYQKILTLLGNSGQNGTGLTAVTFDTTTNSSATFTSLGYSTSESGHYASEGGQVLVVHSNLDDGGSIQNVITWGNNFTTESIATPEPSTMALAGLGALGFLGYGWKRRKSF